MWEDEGVRLYMLCALLGDKSAVTYFGEMDAKS